MEDKTIAELHERRRELEAARHLEPIEAIELNEIYETLDLMQYAAEHDAEV